MLSNIESVALLLLSYIIRTAMAFPAASMPTGQDVAPGVKQEETSGYAPPLLNDSVVTRDTDEALVPGAPPHHNA